MAAYFVGGFELTLALGAGATRTLATRLDDAIPFVPWTIYLYSSCYPVAFYPLFVIKSAALLRRTALAYVTLLTVAFLTFWLFPVTTAALRPDVGGLDANVFHDWGVKVTYALDPPRNVFPSLHLALAVLAALAAGTASRAWGLLAWPIVAGVAVAIFTVKQHFLVDGPAGVGLAVAVWAIFLRRPPAGERAFSARGPAAYLAFHALIFAGFYAAFRLR